MKIYLVEKNTNMTDGMGSMVIDRAYADERAAKEYVDRQIGIMGRKLKWSEEKFGEWRVRELEVIDYEVEKSKSTDTVDLGDEVTDGKGRGGIVGEVYKDGFFKVLINYDNGNIYPYYEVMDGEDLTVIKKKDTSKEI